MCRWGPLVASPGGGAKKKKRKNMHSNLWKSESSDKPVHLNSPISGNSKVKHGILGVQKTYVDGPALAICWATWPYWFNIDVIIYVAAFVQFCKQYFNVQQASFQFPKIREFKCFIWIPENSGVQMLHLNSQIFGNSLLHLNSQKCGNSNASFEFPKIREFKCFIWIPEN